MKDPYHVAWNRIHHLMQRMNFEIVLAEFEGELFKKGSLAVEIETAEAVEDTGFFSFFRDSDKRNMRRFKLNFTEETNDFTRVDLIDESGDPDTSSEGAEFLSMLFEQIK
jgi:uncharacterized lipoprotein